VGADSRPDGIGTGASGGRSWVVQGDALNRSRIATDPLRSADEQPSLGGSAGKCPTSGTPHRRLPKDSVANVSQVVTLDKALLAERRGKAVAGEARTVAGGIDVSPGADLTLVEGLTASSGQGSPRFRASPRPPLHLNQPVGPARVRLPRRPGCPDSQLQDFLPEICSLTRQFMELQGELPWPLRLGLPVDRDGVSRPRLVAVRRSARGNAAAPRHTVLCDSLDTAADEAGNRTASAGRPPHGTPPRGPTAPGRQVPAQPQGTH